MNTDGLQKITDEVRAKVGAERAAIVLSEEDGEMIHFVAASGPHTEGMVGARGPAEGSGLCGTVLAGSCSVLSRETAGDDRVHQGHTVEMGIDTALGVPVYRGEEPFAVLMAMNKAPSGKFDEADESALEDYAASVADTLWEQVQD